MKNISNYFYDILSVYPRKIDKSIRIEEVDLVEYGNNKKVYVTGEGLNKLGLSNQDSYINVNLVLRSIMIDEENQEINPVLILPARLKENVLYRPFDLKYGIKTVCGYPWISTDYLAPYVDEEVALCHEEQIEKYIEENFKSNDINFNEYLKIAEKMFDKVCNVKEFHAIIKNKVYIYEDKTHKFTSHIRDVYWNLIENKNLKLYDNISQCFFKNQGLTSNPLCMNKNEDLYSFSQSTPNISLSKVQKKCLLAINEMNDGQLITVQGPPGTGKTTLIQSIVATLLVRNAFNELNAPIVLAVTPNNESCINIINNMNLINYNKTIFDKRWISFDKLSDEMSLNLNNLSMFFYSRNDTNNDDWPKDINYYNESIYRCLSQIKENDVEILKDEFLDHFSEFFYVEKQQYDKIDEKVTRTIHNLLKCIEKCREIIAKYGKDGFLFQNDWKNVDEQKLKRESECSKKSYEESDNKLGEVKSEINHLTSELTNITSIIKKWNNLLNSIPKIFKKISLFNKLIIKQARKIIPEGIIYFSDKQIENITNKLNESLTWKENELNKLKERFGNIKLETSKLEANYILNNDKYDARIAIKYLKKYIKGIIEYNNLETLNNNLAYLSFWTAIHYYEAKLLYEFDEINCGMSDISYKQKELNILSLITPCFVATKNSVPKIFKDGFSYLYEKADLLVIDEAGEITPEEGLCSLAFAKKAVIIGDKKQLKPVSKINKGVDSIKMATHGLISMIGLFGKRIETGMNCCYSSMMEVCEKCSFYTDSDDLSYFGFFLNEHRRCYGEIIKFCSDLFYDERLLCVRTTPKNLLFSKPMVYHEIINPTRSEIYITSRRNKDEAKQIVSWLNSKYCAIKNYYINNKGVNYKFTIGVITPFKAQAELLQKLIHSKFDDKYTSHIQIGTVHDFQGKEKDIILFSLVYHHEENCKFINWNSSLLNVAVSRAKDTFVLFGDKGCLMDPNNELLYRLKKDYI